MSASFSMLFAPVSFGNMVHMNQSEADNFHLRKLDLKEAFHELSYRISNYAYQGFTRLDFLKQIARLLLDFSGCDEIQFWLPDFEKQKRCEMIKQTKEDFHFSIKDLTLDGASADFSGPAGEQASGDELCRGFLEGRSDVSFPGFSARGGCWIHSSGDQGDGVGKNYKIVRSYDSHLVVPLICGERVSGILQLKDRRPNYFRPAEIDFYENFAQMLGILLSNQRAQAALRERVKELTCMYGIAQAASAGLSMDEIMQTTAALLPPAWQYPKIACGKILLDGRVYQTPGAAESPHVLAADILVHGEKRGEIQVVYAEPSFPFDEGPFLKEERNLIDNIARALSLIIEQKQSEEEKARLTDQIRHADRLATIGQLAAGVAHELNEPLGAILGFAQLMQKNEAAAQTRQDIERIVKASLHAREIVKKLLIFSRQLPTRKIRVDLNQIVTESLYFLESRCAQGGIRVVRELESDLPGIIADPSQLTQVLVNLIVNALQAMGEGGTLTVQTRFRDDRVVLVIGDTGTGMSNEVIKQIFLPFFTTKDVGQGTGLGLAVVHGIVTSHGGTISVRSEPGRGSQFEIRFPGSQGAGPL